MILLETSVLVSVVRDRSGSKARAVLDLAGSREIVLSRFSELELLLGARDENDWERLGAYLSQRRYLDPVPDLWRSAARIYYELQRAGVTVRSIVDCCIAQIAIDYDVPLIHDDRDFERIGSIRPLKHIRFNAADIT